jgi:hypothetical protein
MAAKAKAGSRKAAGNHGLLSAPPVLIVTRPVLVNPAVTIGRLEQRTLRVHIHSSATS